MVSTRSVAVAPDTSKMFQSAMRIFGGFNANLLSLLPSFGGFQSAMRIFGGFNRAAKPPCCPQTQVSIRHADFRWFQLGMVAMRRGQLLKFQSAMRIFGGFNTGTTTTPTARTWFQSAIRIFGGFNFRAERGVLPPELGVSIRHADFRWFQRIWRWR